MTVKFGLKHATVQLCCVESRLLPFTPSRKLERALKAVQAEVNRLAEDLAHLPDAEAWWLHRWALISASTRIENAVLTDAQMDWVDNALSQDGHLTAFETNKAAILDKLSKDRERSVEEVVGCREVLGIVYLQAVELFPLTGSTVSGLHHTLLGFYPAARFYDDSYKTSPNQVLSVTGRKIPNSWPDSTSRK